MKKHFNPALPVDYRPKAEREQDEVTLVFKPCCNCGKAVKAGFYGRFGEGGVCSKKCNEAYELTRPKMIDYQPGEHHEPQSNDGGGADCGGADGDGA